jgi:hypothetical protein
MAARGAAKNRSFKSALRMMQRASNHRKQACANQVRQNCLPLFQHEFVQVPNDQYLIDDQELVDQTRNAPCTVERAMDKTIDLVDTSRTVVIAGSRLGTVWKLVWSVIGALVASGAVVLLIVLLQMEKPSVERLGSILYLSMAIGYLLVLLCTVMAILCIVTIFQCRRFLKISANVLTITPDGIRDRRLIEEFVPWRAVKSVRTAMHEPDYYLAHHAPGRVSPMRHSVMDVVLDVDPALISQTFKTHARVSGMLGAFGERSLIKDTRPWMTFTIDLWRLKNTDANWLYDVCEAYATAARGKRAA